MEIKNKGVLTILGIGIILLLLLTGWIYRSVKSSHIELGADQQIDITPQQIQSIKDIGEWEFLSISDEEMVDTIRRGIFTDDHLVRIYYGTLRLGVNLKQVESGWITPRGDTLEITLPKIGLLDRDFIDEARTRSFYESGSWTTKDREALFRRAYQRMLQRGLTPQNIQIAEQNGNAQVRQVMQSMGFRQVKIQYKD
ncbi:MAG: DUF4230 domain-containing protein [Prevotella sp.]|nr:DUF4230 domain-containing protein [Prevotella sp.]MBR1546779.1 DUF4230 domain-containing protein [Prevotella sp.]